MKCQISINNKFLWVQVLIWVAVSLGKYIIYSETVNKLFGNGYGLMTCDKRTFIILLFTYCFNSLPNDKVLAWFKLKAFADVKMNVTYKQKFFLELKENIVGKGENAGYQHFLLFPQCFQKVSFSGPLKVGIVW